MKLAQAESQALQAAVTPPKPVAKPGRTLVVVSIVVIVLCALAVGGLLVWKQLLGGGLGLTTPPSTTAPAATAPAAAPADPK